MESSPEPPQLVKKLENAADRLRKSAFKRKDQPMSPFGSRYGGFHRRMLAACVDTLVLSFTILPFSYILTNALIGSVDMNLAPLFNQLQYVAEPAERAAIIQQFLVDGGRLRYFNINTTIQLVGVFIYCIFFWQRFGATPGKMVTGLEVVHEQTGKRLTFPQAFWRCVGYVVGSAALCLGVLWISIDKRRQGWHDKLGMSVVIARKKEAAPEAQTEQDSG